MKTERSKACDISSNVKWQVFWRDGGNCIFCGSPGSPNCHVISRANGGLGIEQNIITACINCHNRFDFGSREARQQMYSIAVEHLKQHYPDWDEQQVRYKKWYER